MKSLKFVTLLALTCAFLSNSTIVRADATTFKKKHPRRTEVLGREKNQAKRIKDGVKNGTMTQEQADKAKGEIKAIRQEQAADVKANGGHLTKEQQQKINGELNQTSKEIYGDRHPTMPAAPAAPAAPAVPAVPAMPTQ